MTGDNVTADEALLALEASTEYVELFCRNAGVAQITFAEGVVEVVGATTRARGRTLEDALRRLYSAEVRS